MRCITTKEMTKITEMKNDSQFGRNILGSFRIKMVCVLTFFATLLMTSSVVAQQKAVDGSLQILTPYPISIADLASRTADKVKAVISTTATSMK